MGWLQKYNKVCHFARKKAWLGSGAFHMPNKNKKCFFFSNCCCFEVGIEWGCILYTLTTIYNRSRTKSWIGKRLPKLVPWTKQLINQGEGTKRWFTWVPHSVIMFGTPVTLCMNLWIFSCILSSDRILGSSTPALSIVQ